MEGEVFFLQYNRIKEEKDGKYKKYHSGKR